MWPAGASAMPRSARTAPRRASLDAVSPMPTPPLPLLAAVVVALATAAAAWPTPLPADSLSDAPPALPPFLVPCHRSDPFLNKCLRRSLNKLLRDGATGSPSLELPPLDPLFLPLLDLSTEAPGNLTLQLQLKDVRLRGLSNATVVSVRANLAEQKFEVASRLPLLLADGTFSSSGAVLSFPLSAAGNFLVNMTEVSLSWIMYYHEGPVARGGPDFILVDSFEMDLAPVDVAFHFGDALDGDNLLGEALNHFLNTNAHEVFGDVRTRAASLLGAALRTLADTLLAAFPAKQLLPD